MVEQTRSPEQNLGPIQKWEAPQIVEAADEYLRRRGDEAALAVQIEEQIARAAPAVADTFKQDPNPCWIMAEEQRLLACDAPTYAQRVWASWFYECLYGRIEEILEAGDEVTPGDVRAYHRQFQRRNLSDSNRTRLALWENQGHAVDFSLEHVLGTAKRSFLLAYRLREEGRGSRNASTAALTVHDLLQRVVAERSSNTHDAPDDDALGRLFQAQMYIATRPNLDLDTPE